MLKSSFGGNLTWNDKMIVVSRVFYSVHRKSNIWRPKRRELCEIEIANRIFQNIGRLRTVTIGIKSEFTYFGVKVQGKTGVKL